MNRQPAAGRDHTGDTTLDRIQSRLQDITNFFRRMVFARGRAVTVKFAAGGTYYTFSHRLGTPAGCFVIRQNSDAGASGPAFAENPDQSKCDRNNQLILAATTACVVDLWFYPLASKPIPDGKIQSD